MPERFEKAGDLDEVAFEIIGDPDQPGPFVFTCEHASNRLPWGMTATDSDRVLLDDHWGWDVGAAEVTRELVARLGGQAVLSRFSRLVCDPNRSPDQDSFIVASVDGQPVSFNQDLSAAERQRRVDQLFAPYHDAIDRTLRHRCTQAPPPILLPVHSFTPLYLGRARPMEIGVLFNDYDELAWRLEQALAERGFESALNAPYSGKPPDRLIYAARRHGAQHGVIYLELEIRQDLVDSAERARAVAGRVASALEELVATR